MSPFGFGPPDNGDSAGDPNGGNFDFNEMMAKLQQEFQKIAPGFANPAFFSPAQGALPKDIIRETAKAFIITQGSQPIGANDIAATDEAFSIANTWLDDATVFPAVTPDRSAISPLDWLNETVNGWHGTFEPLAVGLADAISKLIEEASSAMGAEMGQEGRAFPLGPMGEILRGFIGTMLATQLGQTIGALADASKGAHDAALPINEHSKPALLPQSLRKFGEELQIPAQEIAIYFALREAATVRLFEGNPWLVAYMKAAIVEYGRGIHIDLDAIQRQAEEAMSNFGAGFDLENTESFTIALNNGLFTPEESPAQSAALEKLETALALIDGWIDEVITLAANDRLPSLNALTELLRRERVSNSPIQKLFKALFNLEVSPKYAREASVFWRKLRSERDIKTRDKIWSGILPTEKELADPIGFMALSEVPDDISGLF